MLSYVAERLKCEKYQNIENNKIARVLLYSVALDCSKPFFSIGFLKNFKYVISASWPHRKCYKPKTLLTIPSKGIDNSFEKNIASFILQDYPDFIINFVVESDHDPAYQKLSQLKKQYTQISKAKQINILTAGITKRCSQKIHNLLHSYHNCPDDIEVLAFADSDICAHSGWLEDMVCLLSQNKTGVTTGYRWFVPEDNNPASISLSIANAKIMQFLGQYKYNQVWGGSMAIKKENFEKLGIREIWPGALSDDYSLSYAVKKAGKKVVFIPGGIVASYEKTTWSKLFEFARRQFLITRVFMPEAWFFALVSSLYAVAGLFGSLEIAIYAMAAGLPDRGFYMAVPIVFVFCQLVNSLLRFFIIKVRLKENFKKMRITIITDFLISPFCSILILVCVLSAAFGRTITWRGVRYKLVSPDKTVVL